MRFCKLDELKLWSQKCTIVYIMWCEKNVLERQKLLSRGEQSSVWAVVWRNKAATFASMTECFVWYVSAARHQSSSSRMRRAEMKQQEHTEEVRATATLWPGAALNRPVSGVWAACNADVSITRSGVQRRLVASAEAAALNPQHK